MADRKQRRRQQPRKREQRGRRRAGRQHLTFHEGPRLGPGVTSASLDEVVKAVERYENIDWKEASALLLPVLPRVRPLPDEAPAPLQTLVEPGIVVGFGIDIGPAFLGVSSELAASWKVGVGDLLATSLANVHARAALVDPSIVVRAELDGAPVECLQTGVSIGSTLVLAPDELRRIFGPGPRLFITPMRDLIIGLPIDVGTELARWLHVEIAAGDPNCLGPIAYRWDGQRIAPQSLEALELAPPVSPLAGRTLVA